MVLTLFNKQFREENLMLKCFHIFLSLTLYDHLVIGEFYHLSKERSFWKKLVQGHAETAQLLLVA